jgi:acyl-coenzyme A synthetase/AMP-(fatty) acid ligase
MHTLGDLVARERRSDATALRADPADRAISYHDFCTTAWKAGNFLRYLGVGPNDTVAVADDPAPEPVLTFLGAALLGSRVRFGVDAASLGAEGADAPRVVTVPAETETDFDLPGGSRLLVYGDVPSEPRTAHWEGDVWSENPAFPPVDVHPEDVALVTTNGATLSHAATLERAREVAEANDIAEGTTVAVRASTADPGVVVAGLVAPLLAGGTVVFPDGETECDVAVGDGPEPVTVDPGGVL